MREEDDILETKGVLFERQKKKKMFSSSVAQHQPLVMHLMSSSPPKKNRLFKKTLGSETSTDSPAAKILLVVQQWNLQQNVPNHLFTSKRL